MALSKHGTTLNPNTQFEVKQTNKQIMDANQNFKEDDKIAIPVTFGIQLFEPDLWKTNLLKN